MTIVPLFDGAEVGALFPCAAAAVVAAEGELEPLLHAAAVSDKITAASAAASLALRFFGIGISSDSVIGGG
jgi:hypothetical protein